MTQIFRLLSETASWTWGFHAPASGLIQQSHGNFVQSGVKIYYFFCLAHVRNLIHAHGGVLRFTHSPHSNDTRMLLHSYRILTRLSRKSVVLSLHHADLITNESLAAAATMLTYCSRRFRRCSPTAATIDVLLHWSSRQP
jgi:hypothetical protein